MKKYLLMCLLVTFFFLHSAEKKDKDIQVVSKTMGHLLLKDFKEMGVEIDIDSLVQGIQEAQDGKPSPMSEEDWMNTLSTLQEKSFELTAQQNLAKAERFLQSNKGKEGVQELIKDHLQYQITQKGSEETVLSYHTPLIRYKGSYLNGEIFGSSEEGEIISFDDTIAGFRKGIIGMKKNEKRTLFIHPELGYGKNGYLKPNALLIYEVEILDVDVSPQAENPFKQNEIVQ